MMSRQKEVEVFGSVFCPYCHQAKRFLKEKGIAYSYREIPMAFGWKLPLPRYFEMKRRSGGKTTVPQIFVGGDYFGDEERLFAADCAGAIDAIFWEAEA